jgi:succinate dehydrogenase hydrophobic anchor subunit
MKAETVSTHRGGMWPWLFQRITAVLLIVCLAIHLGATHLFNIGQVDSDNIAARLANMGMTAVDLILLSAGIFHALNGFRMVAMDYWFSSPRRARILSYALWVFGLVLMGYGTWALWPWIG